MTRKRAKSPDTATNKASSDTNVHSSVPYATKVDGFPFEVEGM
jgi:hypothetical protein